MLAQGLRCGMRRKYCTVSRSLSGSYGVHEETRKKVLVAAERMSYRPNRLARGMARALCAEMHSGYLSLRRDCPTCAGKGEVAP